MSSQTTFHPVAHKEQQIQAAGLERRQSLSNEVAEAIENSFPARLRQLLQGATVTAHPLCSGAMKAEAAKLAKSIADLHAQLATGVEQLKKALASCTESGTYGDVWAAVEQVKFDKAGIAQQVVSIWSQAHDLACKIEAELKPLPDELGQAAETVVDDVKKKLAEIGSGIESMVASTVGYHKNPKAAEHQFDYAARQNVHARKALAAAEDARGQLQAAAQTRGVALRGLEAARTFLHGEVLRAIQS
jgi:hypothetical protein